MNKHFIHGRLTRDPELTQGSEPNKDRVNFTVAVDRRFGDETDFIDCVMFGKRASVISKFFAKGSEIACSGEGQIRTYTDKEGVKRKSYSIVVDDFDFCGSKKSGNDTDLRQAENEARDLLMGDTFEAAEEDCPF